MNISTEQDKPVRAMVGDTMSSFSRLGWSVLRFPIAMAAALTATSLANAKEAGQIKP